MMRDRLGEIYKRGRNVLRERGICLFTREAFLYFKRRVVTYQPSFVYENTIDVPDYTPKIDGITLKIISLPAQADEMVASGTDFGDYYYMPQIKRRLARGAILFCAFVGKEIAHTSWVALTDAARKDFEAPLNFDFSREACIGDTETRPKFQRLGIYTYVYTQAFRYLREKGYARIIFTVSRKNIPPRKTQARLGSKIIAEGYYLKVLGRESWKETARK